MVDKNNVETPDSGFLGNPSTLKDLNLWKIIQSALQAYGEGSANYFQGQRQERMQKEQIASHEKIAGMKPASEISAKEQYANEIYKIPEAQRTPDQKAFWTAYSGQEKAPTVGHEEISEFDKAEYNSLLKEQEQLSKMTPAPAWQMGMGGGNTEKELQHKRSVITTKLNALRQKSSDIKQPPPSKKPLKMSDLRRLVTPTRTIEQIIQQAESEGHSIIQD